jgi:titin
MPGVRFVEIRRRAASEPLAFAPGDWALSDATTGGALKATLLAVPGAAEGRTLGVERSVDGGPWVALGLSAPGSVTLDGLVDGAPVGVTLRLVEAAGPGPASDLKTATPTRAATAPAALAAADWRLEADPALGDLLIHVDVAPADGGAAIAGYACRIDGGPAIALGGGAALGVRVVSVVGAGPFTVEIRASNAAGPGPWSLPKLRSVEGATLLSRLVQFGVAA